MAVISALEQGIALFVVPSAPILVLVHQTGTTAGVFRVGEASQFSRETSLSQLASLP